jgi:hypothetical protein
MPCPAGCGSIVKYPFLEMDASHPRAVLGMFDVSARPFVPGSTLSFAIPMTKFAAMIDNMEESFLITESWKAVRRRMGRGNEHSRVTNRPYGERET